MLQSGPMEGRSGSCMYVQTARNVLWIFGGRNDAGIGSNDVFSFDLAEMQWKVHSILSNGPSQGRFGMTCFQKSETELCIYGGQQTKDLPGMGDSYCFDTEAQTWINVTFSGDYPGMRNDASDVDVGSFVYLIGGNGTADDRTFILDVKTFSWQYLATPAPRPQGRGDAAMGQMNAGVFVHGGREGESGALVEGATWTLSGGRWHSETFPKGPSPRWGAAGCILPQSPSKYVMFGGVDGTG